jgi:hypothetical protein
MMTEKRSSNPSPEKRKSSGTSRKSKTKTASETSPSKSTSPPAPELTRDHLEVIAELQRLTPADCGRAAAPILSLLNLIDGDEAGAEVLGTPIHDRLWDADGELRGPLPSLIEWLQANRPGCYDPLVVAMMITRVAAVLAIVEVALDS